MCSRSFSRITAQLTGMSAEETGSTTARPPLAATPLGLLAGPGHMPVKASPLERRQRVMGAAMMNLGQWRRPFSYTSPMEEAKAVHERVGVIDLSSLGKLEVVGEDAPLFLDRVYTHAFSTLGVGRIRYGVMCSNSGVIVDDGTVTRLAPDRYFITTTTGNVDAIEEWLKLWLAGTGPVRSHRQYHLGPCRRQRGGSEGARRACQAHRRRSVPQRLSLHALLRWRGRRGSIAVDETWLCWRGRAGKSTSPRSTRSTSGTPSWRQALSSASPPSAWRPSASSAWRRSTSSLARTPTPCPTPWKRTWNGSVRFDKPDFIGKQALEGIRNRGYRNRLVGFVMNDATVPPEGNPVVADGKPVGRVTSSRLSPTLNVGYGLMWAPVELAEEGVEVHIQINDLPTPARVTLQPFYDPDGLRLRE